ncbi:OmpA family protein [Algibacter sp. Ld11]|uniref:OmpA family protein n=1 Tax=Algibacter sp. Ld11 TaxID=649150 RepID=UPI00386487B4
MNKIKILLIIGFCFTFSGMSGQSKIVAERYFNEYAYVKSAQLYGDIVKKGDSSQVTLQRLADSYYNNADVTEAQVWYELLFDKYKVQLDSEYYYKYGLTLNALGEKDLAKEMFAQYAVLEKDDVRAKQVLLGLVEDESNITYNNITNLDINTSYSDFNGFVNDSLLFIFSTQPFSGKSQKIYKWNRQPFLNVYKGSVGEDAQLGELDYLNGDVNTKYHEATLVISKDGNTMYFTRDNYHGKKLRKAKDKTTNLKLYRADLENGKWVNEKELPFNSDEYSVGHPTLSLDEKELYFVSDMPGAIGGTDLFKVALDIDKNLYGTPKNLGPQINTEGMEMFPFISQDNTLYFSSNGRFGFGLLDIYKTDLSNKEETNVYNLGASINSNMDDFAFTLKDENSGYFSSNRVTGKGDDDVYSFSSSSPCLQTIVGVVTDSLSKSILPEATVKLIDKSGKVLKEVLSDAEGNYTFTKVACDNEYTIIGSKLDYVSDQESVITNLERGKVNQADLVLKALIVGNEIIINPIFFDFDKYIVRDDAEYELEKIVTVMNNHPDMVIKIESHTDSRGSKGYNRELSDKRAKFTQYYLFTRGISKFRIQSAIGYGEDQLLNNCDDANTNNCTEEEHQRNRRSKFIIVSGGTNVKATDPTVAPLHKVDKKPGRN